MMIITALVDYFAIGIIVTFAMGMDVYKEVKGLKGKQLFWYVFNEFPKAVVQEPLWGIIDTAIWPLVLVNYNKVKQFTIEYVRNFED